MQNVFNHPGDLRSGDCKGYPRTEVVAYSSIRRVLRRALLGGLACAVVAAPVMHSNAYAKGDDDEDSEDSDSDSGDEGDGGDGGDGEGGDSGEEDEEEVDKDQPPVTAGGLYNINTYPVAELQRPLTMTQGILQMRAGLGVDVSAQTAFESVGHVLDFRYGVKDNFMLLGGFNSAYNFTGVEAFVGMEASLAYNLIDFRAAFRAGRDSSQDKTDPMKPKRVSSGFRAHVDVGFPFRYVAKKEVAIVALDTLMTIDFDGKPDLNPSLGISTNPIPEVSIVIFAQMRITDFNTDAANFIVPATARVQFSPTQRLDLGAEFRFDNVKPPDGEKFYDQRFLSFYGQARF